MTQFYEYPEGVLQYIDRLNSLFKRVDASRHFSVTGLAGRPQSTREIDRFNLPVDVTISHPNLKDPYQFSTSLVYYREDSIQQEVKELESELETRVNIGLSETSDPNIKYQLDTRHL